MNYEQLFVRCLSLTSFRKLTPPKLPRPDGLLSWQVPASAISSANRRVNDVLSHSPNAGRGSRGAYQKVSAEKKVESEREQLSEVEIGKRAAECGVATTVRFYVSKLPESLNSVRDWRNAFLRKKTAYFFHVEEIRSRG